MAIHRRITTVNYCPKELIEEFLNGPLVASSLNQPVSKKHVMNTMERSLALPSGATIGMTKRVHISQVKDDDFLLYEASLTSTNEVPAHLEDFLGA